MKERTQQEQEFLHTLSDLRFLNDKINVEYGSIPLLTKLNFWFSLGCGEDNILKLCGNCHKREGWSNAFRCSGNEFFLLQIIEMQHTIKEDKKNLLANLHEYANKLFLCYDDDLNKLVWHIFPTENYKECVELDYLKTTWDDVYKVLGDL